MSAPRISGLNDAEVAALRRAVERLERDDIFVAYKLAQVLHASGHEATPASRRAA